MPFGLTVWINESGNFGSVQFTLLVFAATQRELMFASLQERERRDQSKVRRKKKKNWHQLKHGGGWWRVVTMSHRWAITKSPRLTQTTDRQEEIKTEKKGKRRKKKRADHSADKYRLEIERSWKVDNLDQPVWVFYFIFLPNNRILKM